MNTLQKLYWDQAKKSWDKFKSGEGGIMEAVNIVRALVLIIVVGAIGIYIAQTVVTQTGTPSDANLSAMQSNILGVGQTGSSFIIILVIAFIGAIAMAYIFGMMGKTKR